MLAQESRDMARFDRRDRRAVRRARRPLIALIAWLALAATPGTAAAQIPSLVDLSAQYTPPARLDDADAVEAQISSYRLTLNVPIPLSARRFLIPGVAYQVDSVAYSHMPADADKQHTFQAPEVSLLFVQLLPNRWSLSVRGGATLAGGFDRIEPRMIRYNAVALATHALSDRLSIGGGALVTGGFGSILPLPAALVRWKPIDQVQVDAFLPAFVNARYTARNRVEVGARIEVTGTAYAIGGRSAARWPCAAQPDDDPMTTDDETMASPDACTDHITYTVGSAGLLAGVRLTSTIWLTTFAGVSFYRRAEEQNRDSDAVPDGVHRMPAALFVRTSLTWRIPRT
jgi:hypothetical protein